MEEERVTLSAAEPRRVLVLNHLEKGAVTVGEAAQLRGISERQGKRLRAGYRREGASALSHGNRGKRPTNAVEVGLARRVVELAQTTYQGFNQQHVTEMLAEREGLHLSRPTVHRLLKAAGASPPPAGPDGQGKVPVAGGREPARLARGQGSLPDPGGGDRRRHWTCGRRRLPRAGGCPGVLPGAAPGDAEQRGAAGALFRQTWDFCEDQPAGAEPGGAALWPAPADPDGPVAEGAPGGADPGSLASGQRPD